MVKFDPDYSIFGTLAGNVHPDQSIENTKVTYANDAYIALYGDPVGKTFFGLFEEICSDRNEAEKLFQKLICDKQITFEGTLAARIVKYHSRVVDHHQDFAGECTSFIQAGITDITESVMLKRLLYGTSEALKRAAEAADDDTGRHIARINKYSEHLSRLTGKSKKYIEEISKFAQLHDIGKIKIAQLIRLPRKLTELEFEEVKRHPYYGGEMVKDLDGLSMAYDIIIDHHERWDGTGYPSGKKEDEISIAGRIVAIVDVFDALVSERPYKKAFSYEKTLSIFKNGDGRVMPSHFDPVYLRAFLDNYEDFVKIHQSSLPPKNSL